MTRASSRSRGLVTALGILALTGLCNSAHAEATTQVARGKQLFEQHCASCHGAAGQGTVKAPPLVGPDALPLTPRPTAKLRKTEFHTAQDVALFVAHNMPANKPGSLTTEQYYDILAFDLKANGVDLDHKKLTPVTAAHIKLH